MFSHVILGVNDLEKSKKFYDAVFGALGVAQGAANTNSHCVMCATLTVTKFADCTGRRKWLKLISKHFQPQ